MTMFSGHGLYYRSIIIAIAHRERLDLTMGDQSKLRFDHRGMEPLRPEIGDNLRVRQCPGIKPLEATNDSAKELRHGGQA